MKKALAIVGISIVSLFGLASCSTEPLNLTVTSDVEKSFQRDGDYYIYVTLEVSGKNGLFGTSQISLGSDIYSQDGQISWYIDFYNEDLEGPYDFPGLGHQGENVKSGYICILSKWNEENYPQACHYIRWNPLSVGEYHYVSIFEEGENISSFFPNNFQ